MKSNHYAKQLQISFIKKLRLGDMDKFYLSVISASCLNHTDKQVPTRHAFLAGRFDRFRLQAVPKADPPKAWPEPAVVAEGANLIMKKNVKHRGEITSCPPPT